jgi:hypothetical protein
MSNLSDNCYSDTTSWHTKVAGSREVHFIYTTPARILLALVFLVLLPVAAGGCGGRDANHSETLVAKQNITIVTGFVYSDIFKSYVRKDPKYAALPSNKARLLADRQAQVWNQHAKLISVRSAFGDPGPKVGGYYELGDIYAWLFVYKNDGQDSVLGVVVSDVGIVAVGSKPCSRSVVSQWPSLPNYNIEPKELDSKGNGYELCVDGSNPFWLITMRDSKRAFDAVTGEELNEGSPDRPSFDLTIQK